MKTIELLSFGSEATVEGLRCVPEKDDVFPELSFWTGSVSLQNPERVRNFLKFCEQEQFEEMVKFSDIDEVCLYAIIARLRKENGYKLFVLQTHQNPGVPQNCVFTKVIEGIVVREKPSKNKDIKLDATIGIKDILKNLLRW